MPDIFQGACDTHKDRNVRLVKLNRALGLCGGAFVARPDFRDEDIPRGRVVIEGTASVDRPLGMYSFSDIPKMFDYGFPFEGQGGDDDCSAHGAPNCTASPAPCPVFVSQFITAPAGSLGTTTNRRQSATALTFRLAVT